MADAAIRRMTIDDVDAVFAVERATFSSPWSRQSFVEEMTRNKVARYLVAVVGESVVGFGGMHVILDEGHITNIAVLNAWRGQGIGRMLLRGLMQYAANLGVAYLTLEVRESNATAIALYQSFGFIRVNRRKRYYENGEDALIMVSQQLPEAEDSFEEPETYRGDDQ